MYSSAVYAAVDIHGYVFWLDISKWESGEALVEEFEQMMEELGDGLAVVMFPKKGGEEAKFLWKYGGASAGA